jgi:hypothetical protein
LRANSEWRTANSEYQAKALIIPSERLRALMIAEAELGEHIMRAAAFKPERVTASGSIPVFCHHDPSLLQRWTSRWCARHSGTVNSSLTLRPSARD